MQTGRAGNLQNLLRCDYMDGKPGRPCNANFSTQRALAGHARTVHGAETTYPDRLGSETGEIMGTDLAIAEVVGAAAGEDSAKVEEENATQTARDDDTANSAEVPAVEIAEDGPSPTVYHFENTAAVTASAPAGVDTPVPAYNQVDVEGMVTRSKSAKKLPATLYTIPRYPPDGLEIPPLNPQGSPTRAWLNHKVTPHVLDGVKILVAHQ